MSESIAVETVLLCMVEGTTPTILQVKCLRKVLYVLPCIILMSLIPLAFTSTTVTQYNTTSEEDVQKFVNRTQWGAISPKNQTKTHEPYQVIVKHTGGSFCTTFHDCSQLVRAIQKADMEEDNMADIRYNFLIGGDGRAYEGRGWKNENADYENTIDVAFMGNFSEIKPTVAMVTAARELMMRGCSFFHLYCADLIIRPASKIADVGKHLLAEESLYEDL